MGVREAAKTYKVPRSTLSDRVSGRVKASLGRPTELTDEEESVLEERLMFMGTWGFPITCTDLSWLIRDYLNSLGRTTRNTYVKIT